jgi:N-acetylglutamate synthase-like GNAT family acetyltransferase
MREGGISRWSPWADESGGRLGLAALPCGDPSTRRGPWVFELARNEDRPAIEAFVRAFLKDIFSTELCDYLAEREGDRAETLLCRRGREIVGVLQFTRRQMHYGSVTLPVAVLRLFGVIPELWHSSVPSSMLARAEGQMRGTGVPVGFLWTREPKCWQKLGWVPIYRPTVLEANVHTLLSGLYARGLVRRRRQCKGLQIRPARQWDLEALAVLYEKCVQRGYGFLRRSAPCWKALLPRRDHDVLYVAVRHQNSKEMGSPINEGLEAGALPEQLVGYYFRKGFRIVELLAPVKSIALELLVHACQEGAEHNRTWLLFDLVPSCNLRSIVEELGGGLPAREPFDEPVLMAKIWDPVRSLETILPELVRRWQRSGGSGFCSLGLESEGYRLQLELGPDGGKITWVPCLQTGTILRVCKLAELLFRTNDGLPTLPTSENRLSRVEEVTCHLLELLFPRIPFWRSILDDPFYSYVAIPRG